MNIVPIVFAFDNNLAKPACICFSSLMMNAKEDTFYDIFILHSEKENIDKTELGKIPQYYKNCKIQYRTVGSEFDNAFEIRGITTPAYYRLLIPELIPEYDKILYSDVDVIFREDLTEIYETEISEYYIGGVNSLSHLVPDYKRYYDKMQIDATGIIYSGNLLINSKKIKEDGIIAEFKKLSKNNYMFQDMDILNIVCNGKIKYLPPKFCLSTFINEYAVKDASKLFDIWEEKEIQHALTSGLVHYNGAKPWKTYCINFDIWWEYYRKSPFYDEKFYFDFFNNKLNELDQLTLWKRVKILLRYFVYGRKNG